MANRWVKSGKFGALGSKITADGDFLFLGSKIFYPWAPKSPQMVTAAMKLKDACSLEESYDKPRHILKSRDITLPTKVCIVKAMVFSVVLYGCESWTIKKAEHQRTDA